MSFYAQVDSAGRGFEIGLDSLVLVYVCFEHGEATARLDHHPPLRPVADRPRESPPEFGLWPTPRDAQSRRLRPLFPFDRPLHQLGGTPSVQPERGPRCPVCADAMVFYAQLDSVGRGFELPGTGLLLVYICFEHLEVDATIVPTDRIVPHIAAVPVPPFDLVPFNRFQRTLRAAVGRAEPRHRLGGPSPLSVEEGAPRCEDCGDEMSFYAQLDHGADFGGEQQILIWICFHHLSLAARFHGTASGRGWLRKPLPLDLRQAPLDEEARNVRPLEALPLPRHRIGGAPPDIQAAWIPRCASCNRPMTFYAQLDAIGERYEIADLGLLAIWICSEHRQATVEISSY